jgi:hypothetical protein
LFEREWQIPFDYSKNLGHYIYPTSDLLLQPIYKWSIFLFTFRSMTSFALFSVSFALTILLATCAHGIHVEPDGIVKTIEVI